MEATSFPERSLTPPTAMAGGDLEKQTLRKARVLPCACGVTFALSYSHCMAQLQSHISRALDTNTPLLLEPPFGFLAHHFRHFIRILYSLGTYYF